MNKLHFLDIGFNEDTVVYELLPKEIARLPHATAKDIAKYLTHADIRMIVIDAAQPQSISELRQHLKLTKVLKAIRIPKIKEKQSV